MHIKDCDVCLSAGSVNKWGICEICGEEFEETVKMADWRGITFGPSYTKSEKVVLENAGSETRAAAAIGQDAA